MKNTIYLFILFISPVSLLAQAPMEYNGNWQFNKRQGQGKMIYYDGSVYDGQWQNNKRQGQGSMNFQNGESYVGNWNNGAIQGTGTYSYKNGEKFEGQFSNGKPHGTGTYSLKSGDSYAGEVSQGVISGQGKMAFASGNKYEGSFSSGKMVGSGTMSYSTGDNYKGQWSNNQREGYGVQNFANGDVYDGSWKNDKMFGIGVLNKASGEKYVGEFNKVYSGMGRLTNANGDYIEGDFKNGLVDGSATIWYANGEQYKGEVKKGQPDGLGTYFYTDNTYYDGELKKGKPDGMGKLCDASGEIIKGGKWSKGGLKKTYEQIQAGKQAFAEGMQALAQGVAAVGQQMQAQDAQFKAQVAANNAKYDQLMRDTKQSQDNYNKLYQEELNKINNNPYSKNNPMKHTEARALATMRMQKMKNTQNSSGTSNSSPSYSGLNTGSSYSTPSYSSSNTNTNSANRAANDPSIKSERVQKYQVGQEIGIEEYDTNGQIRKRYYVKIVDKKDWGTSKKLDDGNIYQCRKIKEYWSEIWSPSGVKIIESKDISNKFMFATSIRWYENGKLRGIRDGNNIFGLKYNYLAHFRSAKTNEVSLIIIHEVKTGMSYSIRYKSSGAKCYKSLDKEMKDSYSVFETAQEECDCDEATSRINSFDVRPTDRKLNLSHSRVKYIED